MSDQTETIEFCELRPTSNAQEKAKLSRKYQATIWQILPPQVENGGDITLQAEDKMTPFGMAVSKGAQSVAEYFISIGN